MHLSRTLLILSTAIALSACSQGESQTTSQNVPTKKPCDLLTAEDILQVTGQAMQPGEEKHNIFCFFSGVEKSGPFDQPKYGWHLQYLHHVVPLELEVQQYHDSMREGFGADAKDYVSTPVPGVGDQAYWEHFANVTQLVVFRAADAKASDFISLAPDFPDRGGALEEARALAQRALKRL